MIRAIGSSLECRAFSIRVCVQIVRFLWVDIDNFCIIGQGEYCTL